VNSGDKVGAIVFNDQEIREIKPQRSKKAVVRILRQIVEHNNELSVDQGISSRKEIFDQVLQKAVHIAGHDYLICIISDFFGLSDKSLHHVKQLARHNDVILLPIYDPLAKKLPKNSLLVVSDGKRQVLLDSKENLLQKRFPDFLRDRLKNLSDNLNRFGVPILPIHTTESVALQIRKTLGNRPGKQAGSGIVQARGAG